MITLHAIPFHLANVHPLAVLVLAMLVVLVGWVLLNRLRSRRPLDPLADRVCAKCGARVPGAARYCSRCGREMG